MPSVWTQLYQEHFERYFQKPFDIQVYHDPGGAALKLATYDLARAGFRVYASMGLADKLIQDDEEDFGEAILFSEVPDKEVAQLFVSALFFIIAHKIPLGAPFAIGLGAGAHAFTRRYDKSALYFTQPVDADEAFNQVARGESVGRVLQAFFITPAEDRFLEEKGVAAFEEVFRKQFTAELTPEERVELQVDKSKAKELEWRLQVLRQQGNQALGVRRPSCV